MDERIFRAEPIELWQTLTKLPFESRFVHDAAENVLYLNFERREVKSIAMVEAIIQQPHQDRHV